MFKRIELDAPCVGEIEKKYLCEAIDSGFVSSVGPFIPEFEKKMADFLGVKAAVAVQSGTAAIYIALYELGIGLDDEVIVPSLTFTATVNPVLIVGATPVIVDVDRNTWNIDPFKIKKAVTSKTKAIIPVHLYGNPCAMKIIMDIAKEYNLHVIEDATESLGAKSEGTHTGVIGDFGCFSFNGNKLITTGGGGMVVGDDIEKMKHIRYLINQAKDKDHPGFHSELGFNYRMTNIEAALGLAQFEQMEEFLNKKRIFMEIYKDILGDMEDISFQLNNDDSISSNWFACFTIKNESTVSDLIDDLKNKYIPTRRVFIPLGEMNYLKKYSTDCPNAQVIYNSGICLPSSTLNDEKNIKEATLIIKEVLSE